MNSGKTIFAQLMEFSPAYEFQKCVQRYNGHYKVKHFSCWNQFLCMAFAQLTYRESLRDIEACLRSVQRKLCHMGFRGNASHNTLAHANQVRDWRIYADFAQILISKARRLYTILQILSITLFEKTPILGALSIIRTKELEHVPCNQLTLFDQRWDNTVPKYKRRMIGPPPFIGGETDKIKAGTEACPTKK